MTPAQQPPNSNRNSSSSPLVVWLAEARYATLSITLHVFIVIFAGTYVLFKAQDQTPDFIGEDGGLVGDASQLPDPPQAPTEQPSIAEPVVNPVTPPPASQTVMITTTAVNNTFKVNATPNLGSLTSLANVDSGTIGKVGSGAGNGAAMAGMGNLGRMGSGFFGKKAEAKQPGLIGRFYDLKQTRTRKPSGVTPDEYHKIFRRFVKEGWRTGIIDDYYRAPQALLATQIMIPDMVADEGPKAFGVEKEVQPSRWLVHYQARVSPPQDGVYRFVGAGDDVMIVRFNGKTVLDRCWYQADQEWQPEKTYDYGWTGIPNGFARGDALRLKADQWYDMEVLIGEQPGGRIFACLLMEQEGLEYEKDKRGNPILPVFRLADTPMPELQPGQTLPPYAPAGFVWRAQPGK